jgi:sulfur-carrier protein
MKKNITILAFGPVTDIIGKNGITINDVNNTSELVIQLEKIYPALKSANYALAVNKKIINQSESLEDNAVVALLPPFSGG